MVVNGLELFICGIPLMPAPLQDIIALSSPYPQIKIIRISKKINSVKPHL